MGSKDVGRGHKEVGHGHKEVGRGHKEVGWGGGLNKCNIVMLRNRHVEHGGGVGVEPCPLPGVKR